MYEWLYSLGHLLCLWASFSSLKKKKKANKIKTYQLLIVAYFYLF